ncbi:uncharacterized protein N7469_002686 [Penicillium citrinum]|uniref:Uncharacterized protein n=1 Tax=Penicillium citrinum TaxID=5077 RepID=A0A9W9PB29_PENCI|nr:uncharacterized protein N7469_002686 [Penicillium citrinum]KAJ5241095.1 hypothetical protein N7469_002686 [Penicillium citrinum]
MPISMAGQSLMLLTSTYAWSRVAPYVEYFVSADENKDVRVATNERSLQLYGGRYTASANMLCDEVMGYDLHGLGFQATPDGESSGFLMHREIGLSPDTVEKEGLTPQM